MFYWGLITNSNVEFIWVWNKNFHFIFISAYTYCVNPCIKIRDAQLLFFANPLSNPLDLPGWDYPLEGMIPRLKGTLVVGLKVYFQKNKKIADFSQFGNIQYQRWLPTLEFWSAYILRGPRSRRNGPFPFCLLIIIISMNCWSIIRSQGNCFHLRNWKFSPFLG